MIENGYIKAIASDPCGITVFHHATFQEAIIKINESRSGIALIVDQTYKLCGVLTDGDIRRAVLNRIQLTDPVTKAMTTNPFVVQPHHTMGEISRLLADEAISHVPLVDEQFRLLGIIYETDLRRARLLDAPVVIMAGGLGTRLRPLTEEMPKPMLEVNGTPMMEGILKRFRDLGTFEFYISVNYKADVIEEYFGDGSAWRVQIHYLRESRPLGTAGSLSLMPDVKKPFFVINGDVVTDLDFRSMYTIHQSKGSDFTMAVKRHEYQIPYGVVELDQDKILQISEKPLLKNYVNAGIYVLSPDVPGIIPREASYDMTELIRALIAADKTVCSYSIDGQWVDVGEKRQYFKVNGVDSDREDGSANEHQSPCF